MVKQKNQGKEGQGTRRAGGWYRGTFGVPKTERATEGGVAATVAPVALLCATKSPHTHLMAPVPNHLLLEEEEEALPPPSAFNENRWPRNKHVKIGHVKIYRAHFRVHFREHWKISREHWKFSREHSRGSFRGDPLMCFTQKKPQPSWAFSWTSSCTFSWAFS